MKCLLLNLVTIHTTAVDKQMEEVYNDFNRTAHIPKVSKAEHERNLQDAEEWNNLMPTSDMPGLLPPKP